MKNSILLVLFAFATASCSTTDPQYSKAQSKLQYSAIADFAPGITDKSSVEAKIGIPQVKQLSENQSEEIWAYQNGRLLISFEASSSKLLTYEWSVFSNDRESKLTFAQSLVPDAKFKRDAESNSNPHAALTSSSYTDVKSGTTITTKINSEVVTSIFRQAPENPRQPAKSTETAYQL